jgi:hypothetical protein
MSIDEAVRTITQELGGQRAAIRSAIVASQPSGSRSVRWGSRKVKTEGAGSSDFRTVELPDSDLQVAAQERLRLLVVKALNVAEEQLTKDFAALGINLASGGHYAWVDPRALIYDVISQRPTYYDGYSTTGHPAPTLKQHAAQLAKKPRRPTREGLSAMHLGIVGAESAKFTPLGQERARQAIRELISLGGSTLPTVVSGGCHLGGIDAWAIEEAQKLGCPTQEYIPKVLAWGAPGGYKDRNLQIADASDLCVCIVVDKYPPGWTGLTFDLCYHCDQTDHIKSGGCWTMKQARLRGKDTALTIIPNY